jgi:hypothetical protein
MISIRTVEAVLTAALSSPSSGHTCVSCPYPIPRYPHNNLLPKRDRPNAVFFQIPKLVNQLLLSLSLQPVNQIWYRYLRRDLHHKMHEIAAHSTPSPRTTHARTSLGPQLRMIALPSRLKSETDTSVPIKDDTYKAIVWNITNEFC